MQSTGNSCSIWITAFARLLQVRFRNPIKYKQDKEMFIAPEGLYSGQVLRKPDSNG